MRFAIDAGIAMQRGLVAEDRLELGSGSIAAIAVGVEVLDAEPLLQQERRTERPLHRDLLVEQHAEQHRERLRGEQLVGLGIGGEVQSAAGRAGMARDDTGPDPARRLPAD